MSIFKATFKPYVQRQLNARQDLVKQELRDSRLMQYVSGRTAWTRMTSFVSVNGTADLSKQYILESGTLFPQNGKYSLRSGVGNSGGSYKATIQDGASMGLRPMPGIISVDIQNKSAYGALREATVKYLVHTRRELEDLEVLFMRPGHHVMLEWGWSMFLDTYKNDFGADNTSTTGNRLNISNILMKNFLEPTINAFKEELVHFDIINQMEFLRHKFSGNYDGMVGPVRNFEFKLLPNGSYECTTVIISLGDVLDSLKMNSTGLPVDDGTKAEQQRLATKFEALFLPLLDLDATYFKRTIIGIDVYNNNLKVPGNVHDVANVDLDVHQIAFKNIPATDSKVKYAGLHYISMGAFVLAMSSQFNLFDPRKSGAIAMLDIEIPYPGYGTYGNGLCLASRDSVSIDPTVCMIKNTNAQFVTNLPDGFNISDAVQFREYRYKDKDNLGIIGNIYVCIEHLISKFRELAQSSNGYIDLKQYIMAILKDCSYSLGGINQFEMFSTDATVAVIDVHYVEPNTKKESKYVMNVLGTDSIIKNFNINSKIFGSQATMIAIAAQDRENIAGVQSSSYNYLNRGLSDRLILQKLDLDQIKSLKASNAKSISDQDKEFKKQLAITVKNIRTYLQNFLLPNKRDLSQIYFNKEAAQSNLNSVLLKINHDTNYKAIIPICVEVTIDGMSGLTQGEIFRINQDSLPREYVGSNLGFIITDLRHGLHNSNWETTLSTQCCILDQDDIVAVSTQTLRDKQDIDKQIADNKQAEIDNIKTTVNQNNLQQVYIYNHLIEIIVEYFGAVNKPSLDIINGYLSYNNVFQPGLKKAVPTNDINSIVYHDTPQSDSFFGQIANNIANFNLNTPVVQVGDTHIKAWNTLHDFILGKTSDYNKLTSPLKAKFDAQFDTLKKSYLTGGSEDTVKLTLVYLIGNNITDFQALFIRTHISQIGDNNSTPGVGSNASSSFGGFGGGTGGGGGASGSFN